MKEVFLLFITGMAAIWDFRSGKIPNLLIAAGMGIACWFWLTEAGAEGFRMFLKGGMIPLFLLAVLFWFRMIGAGDIKLFCMTGGFLGAERVLSCMAAAFLMGAVISLILLIKRRSFKKRLLYFFAYIGSFYHTGKWVPYRNEKNREAEFCFAVPVFFSVLFHIGGIY